MVSTETISVFLKRICTGSSKMVPGMRSSVAFLPNSITNTEWARRQAILEKLALECPYIVGDVVRPSNAMDFEKDGFYTITHIAETYSDWKGPTGKDSNWPKNDNPMIVTAQRVKDGYVSIATVNYFI